MPEGGEENRSLVYWRRAGGEAADVTKLEKRTMAIRRLRNAIEDTLATQSVVLEYGESFEDRPEGRLDQFKLWAHLAQSVVLLVQLKQQLESELMPRDERP
jgi:hypothetical protein